LVVWPAPSPRLQGLPRLVARAGITWLRARAWTLHCLAPHDKSIWACARLRSWWLLQGLGFIPTFNHVWWLLVLVMKDKGDEYQVCVWWWWLWCVAVVVWWCVVVRVCQCVCCVGCV
jgi:hypothetical protein